jgi:hypothetical protein
MTKLPFVVTTDSSLQTLGSTYDKDASTYTSWLFDFVATGLWTIQFLLFLFISLSMSPFVYLSYLYQTLILSLSLSLQKYISNDFAKIAHERRMETKRQVPSWSQNDLERGRVKKSDGKSGINNEYYVLMWIY